MINNVKIKKNNAKAYILLQSRRNNNSALESAETVFVSYVETSLSPKERKHSLISQNLIRRKGRKIKCLSWNDVYLIYLRKT